MRVKGSSHTSSFSQGPAFQSIHRDVFAFLSLHDPCTSWGNLSFTALWNTNPLHPRPFCETNSHQLPSQIPHVSLQHLLIMQHRNDVLSQGLAYAESSASHNTLFSASIYPLIGVMPHESPCSPTFSLLIEDVPSVFMSFLQTQHRNAFLHLLWWDGIIMNKGCWFKARATEEQEWMLQTLGSQTCSQQPLGSQTWQLFEPDIF